MIKYKIKRNIVDCEKWKNGNYDVTWSLPPLPLSQTVTLSQTPSPLWSVTYFMDGPLRTVRFQIGLRFSCPWLEDSIWLQCSICRGGGVPLWCLRPPSLYWLPPRWKSQNKSKVLMKPLSIPGISLKGHGAHFLDKCNSLVESILFTIHLNRYVQFGFWNISRDSCQFHVKSSSILFEWSLHEN